MAKMLLIGAEPKKMPRLKLIQKCLLDLGYEVEVFNASKNKRTIVRYIINMFKLLFKRAETYHFFNIPDVIGLPLLLKRGRLVYDIRSPWQEIILEATGNEKASRFAGWVERQFCKRADVIITANPLLRERAIAMGAKDAVIVPNFLYEEMNTEGWEELFDESKATVLYFGKISVSEGSNILSGIIEKTLKAEQDMFDIRFVIAGDGPELNTLKRQVDEAGLSDKVEFLGWVPHEKMGAWIRAADLCIMPRNEGGSMEWLHPDCIWKVNETVSIGTPILATMYGGFNVKTVFHPLVLTKNEDFPGAIINMLEVVLRWGRVKSPVERSWKVSRERLAQVYGDE